MGRSGLSHPLLILGVMEAVTLSKARRVARLHPLAKRLRHDIVRWALASGRSLDFDAITVVLAAKAEIPVPLSRWTEDDVWRLWWLDLSAWCDRYGLQPPTGLADALVSLFVFLEDTNGLAVGSDSSLDLQAALESAGGFGSLRLPASVS